MSFDDFYARFNTIYVIRLTNDDLHYWKKIKGEWKGHSAAGEAFPNWLYNPQYALTTTLPDNKVVVCLSQLDQRGGMFLYSHNCSHFY